MLAPTSGRSVWSSSGQRADASPSRAHLAPISWSGSRGPTYPLSAPSRRASRARSRARSTGRCGRRDGATTPPRRWLVRCSKRRWPPRSRCRAIRIPRPFRTGMTGSEPPSPPPRTSPRQHLAPMVTLPRRGPPRGPMTKGHGPTETRGPPGSGRSRFGSRWVSWPSSLSGSRQHRGGPRPHRRVLVTRRPGRPQKHSRSPRSRRRVRLRRRTNRPAAQLDRPWKRRSPSRKHPRAQRRAPQAGHRFIAHPKSSKPTAERAGPRFPTS